MTGRKVYFPEDELLRLHGYKIHSRPKRGPVLWAKGGETWTHEEALSLVRMVKVSPKVCKGK